MQLAAEEDAILLPRYMQLAAEVRAILHQRLLGVIDCTPIQSLAALSHD
jgi:hypothetical protein